MHISKIILNFETIKTRLASGFGYAHVWRVFCFFKLRAVSKITYQKQPKTFSEQVTLLKSRGMLIPNEAKAEKVLRNISYNRLSAYWFPLLKEPKEKEIFKKDASFEAAFRLYQFDSELRLSVFYAIEEIEIALRTQIIYHQSHKYSSGFWYKDGNAFQSFPQFVNILKRISDNVQESKEEFILKYRRKFDQYLPPAWKSFEIISFRSLYGIYKNLSSSRDKNQISDHFGLNYNVLISWMDTLVYIRNICAHHARLWNIILTISPVWPKSPRGPWVSRWENDSTNRGTKDKKLKTYAVLCILAFLMGKVNPYHTFKRDLFELFKKYPEVDKAHLGFAENWLKEPLWC